MISAIRQALAVIIIIAASALIVHGAQTLYFPKGSERWYPEYLKAMKEPSLFQQSTNKSIEQYRFLWLRTFHKPIAVRVWKDASGITLRAVRLSGAGGYDPGSIEYDESFSLKTSQWDKLLELLSKSSFWDLPSAEKNPDGHDGSQWVLEGQTNGKYQVVDRWTPSSGDNRHLENFVACCRYLLKLSKLQIPKKDDY